MHLARELAARGVQVTLLHAQRDLQNAWYLDAIQGKGGDHLYLGQPDFLRQGILLPKHHANFSANIPATTSLQLGSLYLPAAPTAGEAVRKEPGIPSGAPVLLSGSRFISAKAPETQLELFRRVPGAPPDCHFLTAGRGMAEDEEKGGLLRKCGHDAHAHLLGVRSDVRPSLPAPTFFCSPHALRVFPSPSWRPWPLTYQW